jgi:hypothetical protein
VTQFDDIETELRRIVDRLTSIPLSRAESVAAPCRELGEFLVAQTRTLIDDIPVDATVPALGPQGLGAMIAVLGRDYLEAAKTADDPDIQPVLERLTAMRRSLP